MPFYTNSDQLYSNLELLFGRIGEKDPSAAQAVSRSHLLMRLRLSSPLAIVTFDGRQNPLQILYGPSSLRPDIELEMPAEMFHQILLAQMPFKKVVASGKMRLHGPFLKALIFEDIFRSGQSLYPHILIEQSLDGYHVTNPSGI